MPVVQIDQEFLLRLGRLADVSAASFAGASQNGQRLWMMPPLAGWTGDPLDLAGMQQAFDRGTLNDLYGEALQDPAGTVADCAAAKLQIGYTAVMERAFRTRHMTYRRAVAHAQGRRRAQSEPGGVFTGGVLPHIQRIISDGGDVAG